MMKRPEFLETKRTPRYSLRKLNVGVASVLLGVTIFGINFTDHSVKAATIENVKASNSSPTSNLQVGLRTTGQTNPQKATGATGEVQQSSASNNATANNSIEAATTLQSAPKTQGSADTDINSSAAKLAATVDQNNTTTQEATSTTETVRQGSASKNATANNSTEAATTPQSSPETQGSADTDIRSLDIRSLTAKSAAKLAFMNLWAASDRNAAGTVNKKDNSNTQPAKENQKLANEHNLTSSDNYSSNIYKGTDGKYYKVVTIYGNDYVYHAADIQANGTATGQNATTAEDTKNNINISKEDLGNGKTRWTVVFFPHQGLQNVGSSVKGLVSAKFGIALTNDYQIVGNVDMEAINDPNQKYTYYKFEDGSNSATDITIKNPPAKVDFSFNPKTDVDPDTGLINNSKTLPAYDNRYLQPSYYFTTDTSYGKTNLWQTYFFNNGNEVYYNNAYDGTTPYLGGDHDFHFNNFIIKNKTGVDGLDSKDLNDPKAQIPIIYDTRNEFNSNGVFNSVNFNQAMEFKSHGYASKVAWKDLSQHSSYVISFTTQHTDSHEKDLILGPKNQQFSGISANIYSYQNGFYNMFSRLYGEQRALNAADAAHPYAPVNPKDIIPNWQAGEDALAKINKDYLNNAQINALSSEIHNNAADPDALAKIVDQGNALNDAMKKLGNSIGQYVDPKDDPKGFWAKHKEDTTKESDRYKYANPDKKAAYDKATEATKALINKDTGAYADKATVEKLTEAENNAWSALDGKKPTDTESDKVTAKDGVSVDKGEKVDPGSLVNVTDPAGKQVELPAGSVDWKEGAKPDLRTSGDKTGKVEVTFPDGSKTEVPVHLHVNSDAESDKVTAKDGVSVDKGEKVDPGSLV
uniref:LEA family epithelial adhesin n=1 Tax=Limosilactobacillus sp. DJ3M12 TaxID=2991835 RepID=UPI0024BB25EC